MATEQQAEAVLNCLNTAYEADVGAIHSLMSNRVPCNDALAIDHPLIQCGKARVADYHEVGALGVLNGCLEAAGLPLVCMIFSEDEPPRFMGFGFHRDYTNG